MHSLECTEGFLDPGGQNFHGALVWQVKTVLGAGAFVAADAALGTFTEFSAGLRAAASDDGVRVLLS